MADAPSARTRTVADVMSSPPVTATTSQTLAEAAACMSEARVGSVVVVDGARPIGILTERRSLEDVWHLLFQGELPTAAERRAFDAEIRPLRVVPEEVRPLLPAIARAGQHFIPLDALRTAVSLTAYTMDYRPCLDVEAATLRANALRLCALMPTLIMSLYR